MVLHIEVIGKFELGSKDSRLVSTAAMLTDLPTTFTWLPFSLFLSLKRII